MSRAILGSQENLARPPTRWEPIALAAAAATVPPTIAQAEGDAIAQAIVTTKPMISEAIVTSVGRRRSIRRVNSQMAGLENALNRVDKAPNSSSGASSRSW